jgi:hypothetical protein
MGYQITDCERNETYRYSLSVRTDCQSGNRLVVIQCNPSVASENNPDPTVGKVSLWAEENNFSEVIFLNLFAYIYSYTIDLAGKGYDFLVGPNNDKTLKKHISSKTTVVLAWGGDVPVPISYYKQRLCCVKDILDSASVKPHKVGTLSYGTHPRHGRMWNKNNRKLSALEWVEIIA